MSDSSIPRHPLKFAWKATEGQRVLVAASWCAVLLAILFGRFQYYALSKVVDSANNFETGDTSIIWYWTCLLVCVNFLREAMFRISGYTAQIWILATQAKINSTLFSHLTGHSSRYFKDRFAGALTNKISNASRGVASLLKMATWNFIMLFVGIAADMYLLSTVHFLFSLILLGWLVIFFTLNYRSVLTLRTFSFEAARASSKLRGALVDSATNIDTVQQQAEETYEHAYIDSFVEAERSAHKKNWFCFENMLVMNSFLVAGLAVIVMGLCIYLLQHQIITIGVVVMTFTIFFGLERNLFFIGDQMGRVMQSFGEIDDGLDELLQPYEIATPTSAPTLSIEDGCVELKDICFAYDNDDVFNNLNLKIEGGQKVGIVGPSGAGKSTLVNLLMRQYDPRSGKVLIDGQDIAQVRLSSLRKQIALVPQSTTLFHRTIRENIHYGNLQADPSEIIRAATLAYADEFISALPDGYESYVGERGVKLSGGQRQRLSIARALLKGAPILILDEATSALDSESEHAVQIALEELIKGRTVIAIAHRLSTLRQMDRIIVMDQGSIVEDGNHSTLLAKRGRYYKLWERQSEGFLT